MASRTGFAIRSQSVVVLDESDGTQSCHDESQGELCEAVTNLQSKAATGQEKLWARGLSVFVVPLGSASAARRAIWARQLAVAGGVAAARLVEHGLTHVVIAPEVLPERLGDWLSAHTSSVGACLPGGAICVSVNWLVECVARQSQISESIHTWPPQTTLLTLPPHYPQALKEKAGSDRAQQAGPKYEQECALLHVKDAEQHGQQERQADIPPDMHTVFGGQTTSGQARLLRRRDKFACQRVPPSHGADGVATAARNTGLIAAFKRLQEHYEALGDEWRQRCYRLAVNTLRNLPFEVTSSSDLDRFELRRLGRKTREKICEFLDTGRIGRAECLNADERTRAIEELQDIWGVGLVQARLLLARGCKSVADVRQHLPDLDLNSDQLVGLRYFEEFRDRMPRSEAEEIVNVVQSAAVELFGSRLRLEPCGSFRRRRPTCGDVDVLFAASDPIAEASLGSSHEVLSRLVTRLSSQGFLTDDLKGGRRAKSDEPPSTAVTYFGVCQLPGQGRKHRRIDLKVYPVAEWPFALLSFTGSGAFNRSMRLYARHAGFSLSDHDIRKARHRRGTGKGEKIWTGPPVDSVPFCTERDIFSFLGLAYREPWEREVDASWLSETSDVRADAADADKKVMTTNTAAGDVCVTAEQFVTKGSAIRTTPAAKEAVIDIESATEIDESSEEHEEPS